MQYLIRIMASLFDMTFEWRALNDTSIDKEKHM